MCNIQHSIRRHTHIMLRNLHQLLYLYAQTARPLCFVLLDILLNAKQHRQNKTMNLRGHCSQLHNCNQCSKNSSNVECMRMGQCCLKFKYSLLNLQETSQIETVHSISFGDMCPTAYRQDSSCLAHTCKCTCANHDVTDLILPYYECLILSREFYSTSSI